MKLIGYAIAATAFVMTAATATASPAYLKLEGVKGEAKGARNGSAINQVRTNEQHAAPRLRPVSVANRAQGAMNAPAAGNPPPPPPPPPPSRPPKGGSVIRIDLHQEQSAQGGVNVASGDVDGDGRPQAALLLPAVQKVNAAATGADPVPATSTQGPYKRQAPTHGQQVSRDVAAPSPAPQPLLVPAVQKPGVGSRRVAPRPRPNK